MLSRIICSRNSCTIRLKRWLLASSTRVHLVQQAEGGRLDEEEWRRCKSILKSF
jgi:hypothetical protein